jgi:hypothetical protein
MQTLRLVTFADRRDGIVRRHTGRWHVGQRRAVRPAESQRLVGPALDLITFFVNCSVMATTQQHQIAQRGRPPVRPVPHMMPLADPDLTARKPTVSISIQQSAP